MIAADSSVMISYFHGKKTLAIEKIDEALSNCNLVLPPVVLSELLSDPNLDEKNFKRIAALPILQTTDGYWQRAGSMRSKLIAKKLKSHLADVLIAQSCIDHDVVLITDDTDFRHFKKHCGLKLFEF